MTITQIDTDELLTQIDLLLVELAKNEHAQTGNTTNSDKITRRLVDLSKHIKAAAEQLESTDKETVK